MVLAAGAVILTPVALKALAASAIATLAFGSNFYLFSKLDYFASASETLPLLHTWSLGIEEQFYILVPALIAGAWRLFGWRYAIAIVLLALASFGWPC